MNVTDRNTGVNALLVGDYGSERRQLGEIFQRAGWRLWEAPDRRRALQCLDRNPVQVVIADSEVPHWHWRRVLHDLRNLKRPPALVVASRSADDAMWAEVLNLGGYDVLVRPFAIDEVERVIAAARRQFDRQPAGSVHRSAGPLFQTA